ncbi:MAG TPA: DUF6378 domain-containing protein [Micropepsaceae bacterium]|nr:DUF6378 domain-containing protein [Micropepsaceae bacterium]
MSETKDIQATLTDRGQTHGDYRQQARASQTLLNAMRLQEGWERLSISQCDSLQMIAVKISRILSGNPNHKDHWDDIAGYALLISRQLAAPEPAAEYDGQKDLSGTFTEGYQAIRERMAKGGPGWERKSDCQGEWPHPNSTIVE